MPLPLPWFPPQLSPFQSSHPCSGFLPFDVPPLLCSGVRTAYQVEMTSPRPTIRCNYKVMLFPKPLLWCALKVDGLMSRARLTTGGTWSRALVCAGKRRRSVLEVG